MSRRAMMEASALASVATNTVTTVAVTVTIAMSVSVITIVMARVSILNGGTSREECLSAVRLRLFVFVAPLIIQRSHTMIHQIILLLLILLSIILTLMYTFVTYIPFLMPSHISSSTTSFFSSSPQLSSFIINSRVSSTVIPSIVHTDIGEPAASTPVTTHSTSFSFPTYPCSPFYFFLSF
jgi:hypothetical protein